MQVNTKLGGSDTTPLPPGVHAETDDIPDDREELFRANGRVYTVAKRIAPNVVFAYMRDLRQGGAEYAVGGMLTALLGQATVDALADNDGLTEDEFRQVMDTVGRYTVGQTQRLLGKARS